MSTTTKLQKFYIGKVIPINVETMLVNGIMLPVPQKKIIKITKENLSLQLWWNQSKNQNRYSKCGKKGLQFMYLQSAMLNMVIINSY